MLSLTNKILFLTFVTTSMLAIGMQVDKQKLLLVLQQKKLLLKSLIANFIVIPLVGFMFVKIFQMQSAIEIAFILLACSPGGLSAIQFISKTKDELAYAGEIVFLLLSLSIFISPLMIELLLPSKLELAIPYFQAFWTIILFLLLPLIIGIWLYEKYKNIANKLAKPLAIVGTSVFIIFILITLEERQSAIKSLSVSTLSLIVIFILLTMLIGWLMGGPKKNTRQILASASSMRNSALALLIVTSAFSDIKYELAVVAFSALMILPNMIFTIVMILRQRKSINR